MAEQNNKANSSQDISTIREILMGSYIREYASTFKAIDEHFASNEAAMDERLSKMESDINHRILTLEQSMDRRIIALEQKLDTQVTRLEEAIAATDKGQKQKLSQLFTLLSAQISPE